MEKNKEQTILPYKAIAELFYPDRPLTEEEMKEIENNLYGFIKTLFQIDQRLINEQKENENRNDSN